MIKNKLFAVVALATVLGPSLPLEAQSLYWTDRGFPYSVWRAHLDGTGQEMIVSDLCDPYDIAIDPLDERIYWSDAEAGLIQRANLDGTGVETVQMFDPPPSNLGPRGIALDLVRRKIYWAHAEDGKIQRADMDVNAAKEDVVTGLIQPVGIALNVEAQTVYWTAGGVIQRASTALQQPPVTSLYSGAVAGDISLDVEEGHIYWTECVQGFGRVLVADLDVNDTPTVLSSTAGSFRFITLDLGCRQVYWCDGTRKIWVGPMDGSQPARVLTTFPGGSDPTGIALISPSAGNVNAGAGEVRSVLRAQGTVGKVTASTGTDLTIDLDSPVSGPSDAKYVVWAWPGSRFQPVPLQVGRSLLGFLTNPTPLHPFSVGPAPIRCLRSDDPRLAVFCFDTPRVNAPDRAPWSVTKRNGFANPMEVILQGLIEDGGSGSPTGFSVTNAVSLSIE